MFSNLRWHLISKACALFSSSAVKVYASQAYRNMDMAREHISFTFDPRRMLLSLQMGFSFVRAAVACAILERTSSFEPETIAPRYLKLVTVPNFRPLTLISLWMSLRCLPLALPFQHYLHFIPCADLVETSTRASSSCSSLARASMSSANRRLVIQSIRHNSFEKNVEVGA